MSKHTPGPWEADSKDMQQGADDIFTVSIWASGPEEDRPHIGTVSAFSLMSETQDGAEYVTTDAPSSDKLEEAKANARLIAAAPDLLAFAQQYLADYQSEDGMFQPKHYARMAQNAIAKATGEQS